MAFADPSSLRGSYSWNIGGQLLSDVLSAKVGDRFSSEVFPIASLQCQLKLCPNGNKAQFHGFCRLFIKIVSMPSAWSAVTICRCISAPQTDSKETRIARCRAGDAKGWVYPLPFRELQSVVVASKLDTLSFCADLRILRVEAAAPSPLSGHSLLFSASLTWAKTQHLKYRMAPSLLKKLRHCGPGKMVESQPLGDSMWTVQVCPNGDIPEYAGKCMVVLNLTGLPRGVDRMKIEWNIECAAMNANISSTAEFSVESTGKFCNIGTFADFCGIGKNGASAEFSVEINVFVLALFDSEGREMEADALYSLETVLQTMHALQSEVRELKETVRKLTLSQTQNAIEFEAQNAKGKKMKGAKVKASPRDEEQARRNAQRLQRLLGGEEMQLTQYYAMLERNGFESVQSLYGVTYSDLEQCGMSKLGHRKQLIKCVEREQEQHRKQLLNMVKAKMTEK